MPLTFTLLATFLVSALSLVGLSLFSRKLLPHMISTLTALAAGTMLGATFLHLLPEAVELLPEGRALQILLASFIGFMVLERVLHWRHCHEDDCEVHSFGYLNLVGDALHNFLDGMVIAGAFATSTEVGVVTTLAIALHEIPQELGDFGVLLHAGFTRQQALLANFGVALAAVGGGLAGYLLTTTAEGLGAYLLPVAAGGFLYIASSDLIPQLRQVNDRGQTVKLFGWLLLGVGIMVLSALFEHA
jgi:zinc and cadmium transporter